MRVETFEESLKLGKVWVYQTDEQRGFVIAPNIRLATYIANELIVMIHRRLEYIRNHSPPKHMQNFVK